MRPLLVCLLALPLAACDALYPVSHGSFTARLVNESAAPIHILTEGEAFGSDNRLDAAQERLPVFPDGEPGDTKTFRAGTNGEVRASVTCTLTSVSPQFADVIWDGVGLRCEDW